MSDTLTIRLPDGEKAAWERAAAAVDETVAEYVRTAVRRRAQATASSPWDRHLGSVDAAVPPPTNVNVRRVMSRRGGRKK